jgi:hypothetical protein
MLLGKGHRRQPSSERSSLTVLGDSDSDGGDGDGY